MDILYNSPYKYTGAKPLFRALVERRSEISYTNLILSKLNKEFFEMHDISQSKYYWATR